MLSWICLVLAGICEVIWAQSLKFSEGFTVLKPSLVTVAVGALSMYFLSIATRQIPLGIAYTIWGGIGATGILLVAHYMNHEYLTTVQLFLILIIMASSIGLKISS